MVVRLTCSLWKYHPMLCSTLAMNVCFNILRAAELIVFSLSLSPTLLYRCLNCFGILLRFFSLRQFLLSQDCDLNLAGQEYFILPGTLSGETSIFFTPKNCFCLTFQITFLFWLISKILLIFLVHQIP